MCIRDSFYALPAFAHDGVHIENAYARSNGGIGATGAIFFEITNHADVCLLYTSRCV